MIVLYCTILPNLGQHTNLGRMYVPNSISSVLPLTEGGIPNKSKLVLEVYKLCYRYRLCKNINYFLISRDLLELHFSLLHHATNEMVLDLNMI